ncbi:MAG TPA: hypothetical protein PLR11_01815 [Candidatus Paceibacterota bacterium]|nr:hypothetical protein [Candidatus Paceibacterota bacterium]
MKTYKGYLNLSNIEALKSKAQKSKKGNLFLNVIIYVRDEADNYGNHVTIKYDNVGGEKAVYLGNAKEQNFKPKNEELP